jgi:ABC-type lipoprotein release transport system permease subunit
MTFSKACRLLRINLLRDWQGTVFCALGISIGIGALVFFVGLGSGINELVRKHIFPVDSRAVEVVVPASFSLSRLWGPPKINEKAFTQLSSLPGVEKAFRKIELQVPAMGGPSDILINSFRVPRNIYVAINATGVEQSYIADDLISGVSFKDAGPSKPIPTIASRQLLELYNKSFAKHQGLFPISETLLKTVSGVELISLRLGQNMRGKSSFPEIRVGLSFAGLSPRAPIHGVLIPIDTVQRIHKEYDIDNNYSSVTLIAQSPDRIPQIIQQVKKLGFTVDESEKALAERIGAAVAFTTGALALLSGLICLLAASNIAHAFTTSVWARSKELGILRAVGATRSHITRLVLTEAACVGLLGSLGGIAAAFLSGKILDNLLQSYIPDFPFKPESFFNFSFLLVVSALSVGIVAAVLGAFLPAWRASRTSPAKALSE